MELLFFVMNQIDKLDQLLKDLSNEKKFSATIIDSAGMARLLADHDYLFGSLRALLNNSQVNMVRGVHLPDCRRHYPALVLPLNLRLCLTSC